METTQIWRVLFQLRFRIFAAVVLAAGLGVAFLLTSMWWSHDQLWWVYHHGQGYLVGGISFLIWVVLEFTGFQLVLNWKANRKIAFLGAGIGAVVHLMPYSYHGLMEAFLFSVVVFLGEWVLYLIWPGFFIINALELSEMSTHSLMWWDRGLYFVIALLINIIAYTSFAVIIGAGIRWLRRQSESV